VIDAVHLLVLWLEVVRIDRLESYRNRPDMAVAIFQGVWFGGSGIAGTIRWFVNSGSLA
jgi:hypothetical protein